MLPSFTSVTFPLSCLRADSAILWVYHGRTSTASATRPSPPPGLSRYHGHRKALSAPCRWAFAEDPFVLSYITFAAFLLASLIAALPLSAQSTDGVRLSDKP